MARFKLTAQMEVTAFTVVEAETLDEAIEQARDRDVVFRELRKRNEMWVIHEADNEPQNIEEAQE